MNSDDDVLDAETREVMDLLTGSADTCDWIDDYFYDFEDPAQPEL